jgi:hypothetical protein
MQAEQNRPLIPFLTYDDLQRINASSVEAERNRNLWFDELPIQDDGAVYPVTFHFVHNDAEIRAQILLNCEGDTATLDMSIAEFAGLGQK